MSKSQYFKSSSLSIFIMIIII